MDKPTLPGFGKDSDTKAREAVDSMLRECGVDSGSPEFGVEGAFVGWSPFPAAALTHNRHNHFVSLLNLTDAEFAFVHDKYFNITSRSDPSDIDWALETITLHLWSIITGFCERFNHNVYLSHSRDGAHDGPFEYIDNDRSQWREEVVGYKHGLTTEHRLGDVCIFPRELSMRLMLLHRRRSHSFSLGQLVYQAMLAYEDSLSFNGSMFPMRQASVMDANLAYVVGVIEGCIAERGEHQVLIPETHHMYNQERDMYRHLYHAFRDFAQ
eukprot:TRINITY_DN1542_c2_g1_i1.p1 TRINITY_DN1542_c2_g1~~TRINITY_DN1542_c2_g1_i1.p1  ORF type:complete len:268 (-),score=60.24 TRINITY_DN1542_c2_g1_i1:381-1184(-)